MPDTSPDLLLLFCAGCALVALAWFARSTAARHRRSHGMAGDSNAAPGAARESMSRQADMSA